MSAVKSGPRVQRLARDIGQVREENRERNSRVNWAALREENRKRALAAGQPA